jgi:hypothetical protein
MVATLSQYSIVRVHQAVSGTPIYGKYKAACICLSVQIAGALVNWSQDSARQRALIGRSARCRRHVIGRLLDLSHVSWRTYVADQLADHSQGLACQA